MRRIYQDGLIGLLLGGIVVCAGCSGGLTGTGTGGEDASSTETVVDTDMPTEGQEAAKEAIPFFDVLPDPGVRAACVRGVEFGVDGSSWFIYDRFNESPEHWRVASSANGLDYTEFESVPFQTGAPPNPGGVEYWLPGLTVSPAHLALGAEDGREVCPTASGTMLSLEMPGDGAQVSIRRMCQNEESWYEVESSVHWLDQSVLSYGALLAADDALYGFFRAGSEGAESLALYRDDTLSGARFELLAEDLLDASGFSMWYPSGVSLSRWERGNVLVLTVDEGVTVTGWQLVSKNESFRLTPLGEMSKPTDLLSVDDFAAVGLRINRFESARLLVSPTGDRRLLIEATMDTEALATLKPEGGCDQESKEVGVVLSASMR